MRFVQSPSQAPFLSPSLRADRLLFTQPLFFLSCTCFSNIDAIPSPPREMQFYAHLLSTHPSLSLARRSPGDNSTNNMTPRNDIHYSQQQQQQQQQQHMGGSIHHTTMPFGRFDAQLYETSLEGYREQTVTMAALGKWEMGVIRSVIRALCV